jgi:DNA-binding NarL/FixJ family response regulator
LVSLIRELAKKDETASPAAEYILEPLSLRELEVLRLAANGARDKQIAEKLHISPATVKNHMKNILEKLNVSNRTEAAMVARDRGILTG